VSFSLVYHIQMVYKIVFCEYAIPMPVTKIILKSLPMCWVGDKNVEQKSLDFAQQGKFCGRFTKAINWQSRQISEPFVSHDFLGGGFKHGFMFTPKLGEDEPILTFAYFS